MGVETEAAEWIYVPFLCVCVFFKAFIDGGRLKRPQMVFFYLIDQQISMCVFLPEAAMTA